MTPSTFALGLEARAMGLLANLREGSMSLYDTNYTSELQVQRADFYPNDETVVTADNPQTGLDIGDPLRFFTMEETF